MVEQFGKSIAPLLRHKQEYFRKNDALLENSHRIAVRYAEQPRRVACKNCSAAPASSPRIVKQEIVYWMCATCGHVNGAYEDTATFGQETYTGHGATNYAANYTAVDRAAYEQRCADIYVPKARFLLDAIVKDGGGVIAPTFADFGAGSGYFVHALRTLGADVRGYEVSPDQVAHGNTMLGETLLERVAMCDIEALARDTPRSVVSLVGVLEHLERPTEVMRILGANPAVRHVFITVPLFSPTVFFETAFPKVHPRHLGGRHTHLYTDASLAWLARVGGFERYAEWWFGTDVADLYRSIHVTLTQQQQDPSAIALWEQIFLPIVDDLQLVLDRRKIASEVQLVLRKATT